MAKAKAGRISAERLKSFIERIEKLEEERAAIGSDIKDVYSEAKGVGYDVKTMRKIVSLRKKDAADRDEEDALLDVYMHALGMVTGGGGSHVATVAREPTEDELIEKAQRISKEVDRCMGLVGSGNEPPKIVDIQNLIGCSAGKAHKLRGMVMDRVAEGFSRSNAIEREKGGNENPPQADETTETSEAQQGGGVADSAPPVPRAEATAPSLNQSCGGGGMQTRTTDNEPRSGAPDGALQNSPGSVGVTSPPTECTGDAGVAPGPQDPVQEVAHAQVAAAEPEMARVVPPATDPPVDWDSIAADQRRLNEAAARFRAKAGAPA